MINYDIYILLFDQKCLVSVKLTFTANLCLLVIAGLVTTFRLLSCNDWLRVSIAANLLFRMIVFRFAAFLFIQKRIYIILRLWS